MIGGAGRAGLAPFLRRGAQAQMSPDFVSEMTRRRLQRGFDRAQATDKDISNKEMRSRLRGRETPIPNWRSPKASPPFRGTSGPFGCATMLQEMELSQPGSRPTGPKQPSKSRSEASSQRRRDLGDATRHEPAWRRAQDVRALCKSCMNPEEHIHRLALGGITASRSVRTSHNARLGLHRGAA